MMLLLGANTKQSTKSMIFVKSLFIFISMILAQFLLIFMNTAYADVGFFSLPSSGFKPSHERVADPLGPELSFPKPKIDLIVIDMQVYDHEISTIAINEALAGVLKSIAIAMQNNGMIL